MDNRARRNEIRRKKAKKRKITACVTSAVCILAIAVGVFLLLRGPKETEPPVESVAPPQKAPVQELQTPAPKPTDAPKEIVNASLYKNDETGMETDLSIGEVRLEKGIRDALADEKTDNMIFRILLDIQDPIEVTKIGGFDDFVYEGKTMREWFLLYELFIRYDSDTREGFNLGYDVNYTQEEYEAKYREAVELDIQNMYYEAEEAYWSGYRVEYPNEKTVYFDAIETECERLKALGYTVAVTDIAQVFDGGINESSVLCALMTKDEIQRFSEKDRHPKTGTYLRWMDNGKFMYTDPFRAKEEISENKLEDAYANAEKLLADGNDTRAFTEFEKLGDYKDSQSRCSEIKDRLFETADAGGSIYFGTYEQDNDTTNGKEAIEWTVLERNENKLFLVSKKVIDVRPFHEWEEVTWDNCNLRAWLNSDFMMKAFGSEDRDMILETEVKSTRNMQYNVTSGEDTVDRVFLLSDEETMRYFPAEEERKVKATQSALRKGVESYGSCWWWMRTAGNDHLSAAIGVHDGHIGLTNVSETCIGVRPAMWIELK